MHFLSSLVLPKRKLNERFPELEITRLQKYTSEVIYHIMASIFIYIFFPRPASNPHRFDSLGIMTNHIVPFGHINYMYIKDSFIKRRDTTSRKPEVYLYLRGWRLYSCIFFNIKLRAI